ncbi:MAG: macro domain-containing protein [Thermodesulfobacteriota bacterium]|jgi:O-acetyl-ADP-ribose deacetylase (regulator of RNase III)|nr:macro domain-containing protein [Thermodesulfobacteriota bacterium]
MSKQIIEGITIENVKGDIVKQTDIAAVVNAANARLRTGGGVAGAIHRAAGPGLEQECRRHAPIRPGEAVITGAHDLPNRYVIHCLGPVYGRDEPADQLLADCYRNALKLAESNQVKSIAFPALSTGAFGYPKEEAASIAVKTVLDTLADLKYVTHIRFVQFSDDDLEIYDRILGSLEL